MPPVGLGKDFVRCVLLNNPATRASGHTDRPPARQAHFPTPKQEAFRHNAGEQVVGPLSR